MMDSLTPEQRVTFYTFYVPLITFLWNSLVFIIVYWQMKNIKDRDTITTMFFVLFLVMLPTSGAFAARYVSDLLGGFDTFHSSVYILYWFLIYRICKDYIKIYNSILEYRSDFLSTFANNFIAVPIMGEILLDIIGQKYFPGMSYPVALLLVTWFTQLLLIFREYPFQVSSSV
jgi:hypothetical protein